MTKLRDIPSRLWAKVVWAVERADIVPLMVLVSTWHYAGALIGKDSPLVAVAIGILIDLGQYRSVREYFRGHTNGKLTVMVILTAMTGYYHWLWYSDVILAATMPATIICLALLSKWGGWDRQGNSQPSAIATASDRSKSQCETPATGSETFVAICDYPGCSWSHNHYASEQAARNAKNAHQKSHKEVVNALG